VGVEEVKVTMKADVVDSPVPAERSCEFTLTGNVPAHSDQCQTVVQKTSVSELSLLEVNDCKRTFEQYAQDAIFKASDRELIQIQLLQNPTKDTSTGATTVTGSKIGE